MNKGVIYSVLAALAFSFQNVIVKDLSVSMGTGEIAFFRGTVSAVIIVALMKLQGIHLSHEDRPTLALRGVLGGVGMVCMFYGSALGRCIHIITTVGVFCHALCSDFSERSHS